MKFQYLYLIVNITTMQIKSQKFQKTISYRNSLLVPDNTTNNHIIIQKNTSFNLELKIKAEPGLGLLQGVLVITPTFYFVECGHISMTY